MSRIVHIDTACMINALVQFFRVLGSHVRVVACVTLVKKKRRKKNEKKRGFSLSHSSQPYSAWNECFFVVFEFLIPEIFSKKSHNSFYFFILFSSVLQFSQEYIFSQKKKNNNFVAWIFLEHFQWCWRNCEEI